MSYTKHDLDRAWCAGFFDGEGCIMIQRRDRGSFIEHSLVVVIAQKDIRPLEFVRSMYGGILTKRTTTQCFQWRCHGTVAENFLYDMKGFLRQKDDEAELALELRSLIGIPGRRIPPGIWKKKEDVWKRFRKLREKKKQALICTIS